MSKQDRFSLIALIAGSKVRAFKRCADMTPAQQTRIARRMFRA